MLRPRQPVDGQGLTQRSTQQASIPNQPSLPIPTSARSQRSSLPASPPSQPTLPIPTSPRSQPSPRVSHRANDSGIDSTGQPRRPQGIRGSWLGTDQPDTDTESGDAAERRAGTEPPPVAVAIGTRVAVLSSAAAMAPAAAAAMPAAMANDGQPDSRVGPCPAAAAVGSGSGATAAATADNGHEGLDDLLEGLDAAFFDNDD